MSIAVTGLPCAWHASTKPSSDAKLMLNAPRIFEYFRMPIPLAWPMGVSLSRVRPARQAGLSEQQRSPADEWHDVLSQAAAYATSARRLRQRSKPKSRSSLRSASGSTTAFPQATAGIARPTLRASEPATNRTGMAKSPDRIRDGTNGADPVHGLSQLSLPVVCVESRQPTRRWLAEVAAGRDPGP